MHISTDEWASPTFKVGDKATCVQCGKEIYFYGRTASRGQWLAIKPEPTAVLSEELAAADPGCKEDNNYVTHAPREFCRERNQRTWGFCGRAIKYEDMVAEIYACGHHRKQVVADKERQEKYRKQREKELIQDEITQYEATFYDEAAAYLRSKGIDLGKYTAIDRRYGYRGMRIDRTAEIDVFQLAEYLKGVLNEVHGDEGRQGVDDGEDHQVYSCESGADLFD